MYKLTSVFCPNFSVAILIFVISFMFTKEMATMPKRFDDLYHEFYEQTESKELKQELKQSVDVNHKILIDHLSKEDKKSF